MKKFFLVITATLMFAGCVFKKGDERPSETGVASIAMKINRDIKERLNVVEIIRRLDSLNAALSVDAKIKILDSYFKNCIVRKKDNTIIIKYNRFMNNATIDLKYDSEGNIQEYRFDNGTRRIYKVNKTGPKKYCISKTEDDYSCGLINIEIVNEEEYIINNESEECLIHHIGLRNEYIIESPLMVIGLSIEDNDIMSTCPTPIINKGKIFTLFGKGDYNVSGEMEYKHNILYVKASNGYNERLNLYKKNS